ncbi:unnamed protein product [Allacma fusca]|uniref:Uncharacterized protein n=1 Tax=Allacma fusca TaxID=39272 RepID=A0A8J2J4I2_9HEXA|nr:unnamed protein product [Allacma fusca]
MLADIHRTNHRLHGPFFVANKVARDFVNLKKNFWTTVEDCVRRKIAAEIWTDNGKLDCREPVYDSGESGNAVGTTEDGTKRVDSSGTTKAVADIVVEEGRSSDSAGSNTEEEVCVIFHCISYFGTSCILL